MALALRLVGLAIVVAIGGCAGAPVEVVAEQLPGPLLYSPDDAKWLPTSVLPDYLLVADAAGRTTTDRA